LVPLLNLSYCSHDFTSTPGLMRSNCAMPSDG
jgi:hypothetical protein